MYCIQVHTIIHAIIHNLCDALTRLLQYLASFAECQHCKRNKIKVKFLPGKSHFGQHVSGFTQS